MSRWRLPVLVGKAARWFGSERGALAASGVGVGVGVGGACYICV